MNESQLKARRKKVFSHMKNHDLTPTYEKQAIKKKAGFYVDDRKRID